MIRTPRYRSVALVLVASWLGFVIGFSVHGEPNQQRAGEGSAGARATVQRLAEGHGFVLVPLADADAYALEELIGERVEVRR